MSLKADLLSLSSTLDQMIERLEGAAVEVRGSDTDAMLGAIYDIERHLKAANRRLNRMIETDL